MPAAVQVESEWRDGFLFVGNRQILDFLNTQPVMAEGPTELLSDVHALERWLIASAMVSSPKMKSALRGWRDAPEASRFLGELLAFRERLRGAVVKMEHASLPPDSFVAEINALLVKYPQRTALSKKDRQIVREPLIELLRPSDLWTLFADAAASFLSEPPTPRLRQCESCVVHFLDTSKKGSRRWCSMNICGNKLKVAAYQQRKREGETPAD